ncbi:mucin-5AC-like isoform X1 [Calliphora vicina]|uniref:mucin-5AC-like isoform X1 n=1 Tax=Calliphora vicina TaxID=7373 RepID=UPI00325B19E5
MEEKEEEKQMEEEELKPDSQQESFDKTLAMSVDKAVSTYGIPDLRDYQRAVTYELVFNSLLEKKMQAMKRDCEERKRAKRLKRKSIGRIFFAKRLFSSMDSRKTSSLSEMAIEEELHARTEPSTPQKTMKSTIKTATKEQTQQQQQEQPKSPDIEIEATSKKMSSQRSSYRSRTRSKSKTNTASSESPQTTTNTQQQADDSVTSTLSNSSDKVVVKQNLLVKAQTHMPQEALIVSSSSGDSKNAQTTTQSNGNQTYSIVPPLSLERTQDTASLASGYENGTGARLHSSTMADDSLTSIRDSIESLSFASSRCTVSFGATEVIQEDLDVNMYERLKAAKRQRILDAKSISAQCSPILQPRHVIKTLVHAPMSPSTIKLAAQPPISIVEPIATTASSLPVETGSGTNATRTRFLPNQYSYTDSIFESRNISRQNTSEDSANVTVSTLLNQSDSLSLHAPLSGRPVFINDRFKSKSTSLLVALGNGRTRPPPLPPPPYETAQHSPVAVYSPTTTLAPQVLPIEQLQQLHLTSNLRYSKAKPTAATATALASSSTSSTHTHSSSKAPIRTTTAPPPAAAAQSLHIVTVTTATTLPHQYPVIDTLDTQTHMDASLPMAPPYYTASSTSTIRNGAVLNGTIVASSSVAASDTAKLHRMTSTSTGSSVGPTTGCCTTTKSASRIKEKQKFKPQVALGQSGSDDEYRKKKRKYKRYHRCSDPVLVYPTPSGLQHCILSMPPNDPIQYPYTEDYAYDVQLQIESDKNDDLEKIVPSDSTKRKHRKHRHHRHKKRHRHKKPKILVQDLETQEVKVIDPDDLPQRARWTIIATACLLLLMCLMLVGITLRMAPIIDDMVRQENERLMKETMDRARFGKNFTETASSLLAATTSTLAAAAAAGGAHQQQQQLQPHQQQHNQQQILLPQPQQYPLPHLQQIP